MLTASQSQERALESASVRHRFLTFALVEEGLKIEGADTAPADGRVDMREWFRFAERRVPQLVAEAAGSAREIVLSSSAYSSTQRPRMSCPLFRERSPWIVAKPGFKFARDPHGARTSSAAPASKGVFEPLHIREASLAGAMEKTL